MPNVEIDEAEFVRLSNLNNFASKILANPEAGKLLEKAAKIVDPTAKTPRLDQEAAVQTPLQKMQEDMAALRKEISDRDAATTQGQTLAVLQRTRDDGVARLRQQGWTEDGIKGVEALMEQKGLLDPLDAAVIFEKNHPPQTPTMPGSGGGWNFMEAVADDSDADLKKLIETKGEMDSVTDSIARKALHEVRQTTRR